MCVKYLDYIQIYICFTVVKRKMHYSLNSYFSIVLMSIHDALNLIKKKHTFLNVYILQIIKSIFKYTFLLSALYVKQTQLYSNILENHR